jgi:hypothetical protein
MDTQEAYEKMRSWFSKPNHGPGYDPDIGECAYRGVDENHRCAVGAILPDKLYKDSFESGGVVNIVTESAAVAHYFKDVDISFLSSAQKIHDDKYWGLLDSVDGVNEEKFRVNFIASLDNLAGDFGLNVVTT